jgi:hypothetical protein
VPNQCALRTSCLCIRLQSGKQHTVLQPCFSSVYNLVTAPRVPIFSIPNRRLFDSARLMSRGSTSWCPAVKKLYQLRPKVSASRVSVASRVVKPEHDKLRPAVSEELHQLQRKIGVYKMPNNWKVLTQFHCTLLYTKLYAHIQNC